MSELPVLKRTRTPSSATTSAPAQLVAKRFGWTVTAQWLLQLVAFGWIFGGIVNCLSLFGQAADSEEGLTLSILINGAFDILSAVTMAALLLAASELMYGVACWLAANGSPESGEVRL
jgi:hypothetical protein